MRTSSFLAHRAPSDAASAQRVSHLIGSGLALLALAAVAMQVSQLLQHRTGSAIALLTLAIVFAAALVSSVVGFAFSALAGAALLHLYRQPAEAIEIMVLCSIAIQ